VISVALSYTDFTPAIQLNFNSVAEVIAVT